MKPLLFTLLLFISSINNVLSSAWTRDKNEIFLSLEFLRESNYNVNIFKNSNKNYYNVNSYKLYWEYGLFEKFTFGGYLKNYNFYSQYLFNDGLRFTKVKDDFYANVFLIQNVYNKNSKLISLQYSYYFPIKYSDTSRIINAIDANTSVGFSILFGSGHDFDTIWGNFRYFINSSVSYRLINNVNFDQITLNGSVGFGLNDSSICGVEYEFQGYSKNTISYNKKYRIYNKYFEDNNSNKIQLFVNYKFLDNLSTQFAFYRTFSNTNYSGLIFSFFFRI